MPMKLDICIAKWICVDFIETMMNRTDTLETNPVMGLPTLSIVAMKRGLFLLCLMPLAWLLVRGVTGDLGANPIEAITRYNGDWALRFLLITLAVTPIRIMTHWNKLIQFRRMLGLFGFFYASLHLLSYIVLDQFFAWGPIWEDIIERPYITVGMIAYVLLIPLAITSNNASMRRLKRHWQQLHYLSYPIAMLAVFHFALMVKKDLTEPLIYAFILTLLLGFRLLRKINVF